MTVGVVAIGRNEGERLRVCLASALRDAAAVVYVDSGSSDGSVALAEQMGVRVVRLDLSIPFTAARARNEGFAALSGSDPALVQFVDGDCELVPGWIDAATAAIADPAVAVVCGRRRERHPTASVYNRLCDMEWNTPVGPAKACGGDALIRSAAFARVDGYDATVIAGEEPEMCVRLRQAGWKVLRIDAEMTRHDAAMTRFGQWWKRSVRSGHAYAQGYAMHGDPPERFRAKEVASIRRWATIPIYLSAAAVLVSAVVIPRWCWVGLLPMFFYPLLAAKVARGRINRGESLTDAALYAVAVVVGKFPQWQGVKMFRRSQRRGEKTKLIEYKGPEPTKG